MRRARGLHRAGPLLAMALPALIACTRKDDPNFIKMGFTPAESSERVANNGKIIADLLEKKTGYKFQTYVASDYTALVEAMKSGQVQVGWLAPFSFVLAEKHADARVMLKSVRHGRSSQYSAIIVKDSSPFKTLQDLRGKNIAWTDPSSSSGHIAPKASLISAGVDPDTFFGKQVFAGSHESLVLAVMNGTVDAGATFSDDEKGLEGAWTKFADAMGPKSVKLRAIYVTPPMPSDTVSVSGKFADSDPTRATAVKAALKGLSDTPEGKGALFNLYGIDALVDATSEEYEPLRKAAAKLGFTIGGK